MQAIQVLDYVKAAARAVNLSLDEATALRVAEHLGRTVAMARMLEDADLAPKHELAEIYRPAPFPTDPLALRLHGFDKLGPNAAEPRTEQKP